MPGPIAKKRANTYSQNRTPKRPKITKRQFAYHSSSEDEEERPQAVKAAAPSIPDENESVEGDQNVQSEDDRVDNDDEAESQSGSDQSELSETSTNAAQKRKRNDPDVFATSMSKILGSKLTSSKRIDPVLARSKTAATITKEQVDSKLEEKAKKKLREEKKQLAEKGRIRDVIGAEGLDGQSAEEVQELERRLRKTAQRGVVKLFNAVRAAQVRAEEAERDAKRQGVIGVGQREERINEMSKKGFLDLIAGGGKKAVDA